MISSSSCAILDGKVAVITGGSRGIGKAVADELIANKVKVVIGDILEKEGEAVVKSYNEKAGEKVAVFLRTDVTKYSDNIALFKLAETEFGGVDYALINAGIIYNSDSMFTPLDDKSEERIINTNTTAVIKGTKVALLHMAKRGGGSIVHLASSAGLFTSPSLASYCASKHAVIGYTRCFSLMPNICNVRVNAICPYFVETDIIAAASGEGTNKSPFGNLIAKASRTPMETVVKAFLLLATDKTRNTQTILALPDGLQVIDPLPAPASFKNEKTEEAVKEYLPATINAAKQDLLKALALYDNNSTIV